jgi:hypothetical protein
MGCGCGGASKTSMEFLVTFADGKTQTFSDRISARAAIQTDLAERRKSGAANVRAGQIRVVRKTA